MNMYMHIYPSHLHNIILLCFCVYECLFNGHHNSNRLHTNPLKVAWTNTVYAHIHRRAPTIWGCITSTCECPCAYLCLYMHTFFSVAAKSLHMLQSSWSVPATHKLYTRIGGWLVQSQFMPILVASIVWSSCMQFHTKRDIWCITYTVHTYNSCTYYTAPAYNYT